MSNKLKKKKKKILCKTKLKLIRLYFIAAKDKRI